MIECCCIYAGRAGVCSEPGRPLADPAVALYMMREENTRETYNIIWMKRELVVKENEYRKEIKCWTLTIHVDPSLIITLSTFVRNCSSTLCMVQLVQSSVSLPACSKWEPEDHSSKASRHWSRFLTLPYCWGSGRVHSQDPQTKSIWRPWTALTWASQVQWCSFQKLVVSCLQLHYSILSKHHHAFSRVLSSLVSREKDGTLCSEKNYHDINLTSVISKILEIIILDRLAPIFENAGFPSLTQTAYRNSYSSYDSVFSGQESISKFTSEEILSTPASTTSPVPSTQSSFVGALVPCRCERKVWRLIKDWYSKLTSQVWLGDHLSAPFTVERGIHQGSALSPSQFNPQLVMDSLLPDPKARGMGLNINGLFLGAFTHANDIRTPSTS